VLFFFGGVWLMWLSVTCGIWLVSGLMGTERVIEVYGLYNGLMCSDNDVMMGITGDMLMGWNG
jgi:hypothetical protein